ARIAPELSLARGQLQLARSEVPAARASFQDALRLYDAVGNDLVAPAAYVGLARAEARAGSAEAAIRHLGEALEESRRGSSLDSESERLALLERNLPVARELVALRAAGDWRAALLGWNAYQEARIDPATTPADAVGLLEQWPADRV